MAPNKLSYSLKFNKHQHRCIGLIKKADASLLQASEETGRVQGLLHAVFRLQVGTSHHRTDQLGEGNRGGIAFFRLIATIDEIASGLAVQRLFGHVQFDKRLVWIR